MEGDSPLQPVSSGRWKDDSFWRQRFLSAVKSWRREVILTTSLVVTFTASCLSVCQARKDVEEDVTVIILWFLKKQTNMYTTQIFLCVK